MPIFCLFQLVMCEIICNTIIIFLETEKQVCRFYGHFFQSRNWDNKGPLGYPTIEAASGRRLTILYYLNDQTIEMVEPKTQNSGNKKM